MGGARVSYIKGHDLYASVTKSLEMIKEEIKPGPRVVIKPNFVTTENQLSATKVEQVQAIVDFMAGKCDEIIVAESSAEGKTEDAFRNYGYYDRLKNVAFVDLDDGRHEEVEIFTVNGRKTRVRVAELLMDRDTYIVSAAKLKTHNLVVATLSAKNVIMASMLEKGRMHPGMDIKTANRNLPEVMKRLHIDLAVLDGINAMEGDGPTQGTAKNAACVIASTDFLAADRVALDVMGIEPDNVGYLNYLYELGLGEFDRRKINLIGDALEKKPFKLHHTVEKQYRWR